MTAQEILDALAGADATSEQKEVLKALASNPNIAARAATFAQKSEYDTVSTQYAALQASYAKAKNVEDWYNQNYQAIKANNDAVIAYKERYGELDGTQRTQQTQPAQLTPEQIAAETMKTFQSNIAPNLENQMLAISDILWKHQAAGRKTKPDLAAIGEIAKKYGGNLEAAYDEWDRPAREEAAQATTKADIEKRAQELAAEIVAKTSFPAGSDGTGSFGGSGAFTTNRTDKYDWKADLMQTAHQTMVKQA